MKKNVIFVNAHASRALKKVDEIKKTLKKKEFKEFQLIVVDEPKNLNSKIKETLKSKPELIVFGGGDGTIINGIDLLLKEKYQGKIGVLPIGTANYFAKNLSIPMTIPDSLDMLCGGQTKPFYLAKANGRLFSLMATVGVTSQISKDVGVEQKRKFHQFAYVIELFRNTFKYENFSYSLTYDDYEKPITGQCIDIIIANADRGKGTLKVMPRNNMETPKLKIIIYETQNVFQALYTLVLYVISAGGIRNNIKIIHADTADIKTSIKKCVAIDGEPDLSTPLKVSIIKDPVHIVCM